ncbi:MAG: hypothetical protein FJX72_17105 [Armatimonadetes bacterium]|nr:hypothetical protein [Armatimonadota bacterium]
MGAEEWADFVPEAGALRSLLLQAQKELAEAAVEEEGADADRLFGLAQAAARIAGALSALASDPQKGFVKWCEAGQRQGRRGARSRGASQRAIIHDSPIEVAELLRTKLWVNVQRAVLTSATLANSGAFTYLRSRLGLAEDLDEAVIGSPFDFPSQALLYVPGHLPPPDRDPGPAYFDAIADEIVRIVELSQGRAFLLFTSRRALDEAHIRLIARVRFPLFRQGDMPPQKLLQAYRESECGCLLGNQTFWEGVDVQGAALSVVVIDRIPFGVPDSPITRARTDAIKAAGGDWFADFSLPQAQIRLKQGFGRLIRTRTDRGIVSILDSRLISKSYGPEFVRHLPNATRASIWARVERFWNG